MLSYLRHGHEIWYGTKWRRLFTFRRYRSKAFGGSSQRWGEGGRRAESAKSTPQDRVKKSFCFPFPGSLRTAGRLTVEERTLQFSSFPFLPLLAQEAMSKQKHWKLSWLTHSSDAYSSGLYSQPWKYQPQGMLNRCHCHHTCHEKMFDQHDLREMQ